MRNSNADATSATAMSLHVTRRTRWGAVVQSAEMAVSPGSTLLVY